jgi:putative hemolysin
MPFLRTLDALFGPILGFAGRAVKPLLPPIPVTAATRADDPLQDLLREAELEGIGAPAEAEIISGVVEFGEKRVGDVMTPRDRVTEVRADASAAAVADTVAKSNYTRIPVFGGDGSDVVGVVHAFDVLSHPTTPLATIRGAASATTDEPCGAAMRRMLRENRHLAVVRDTAGGVAGIVTLEDLVEELVGDIRDEHDEPPPATT